MKLRQRQALSSVLPWPNYFTTFYPRSLICKGKHYTPCNIIRRLRTNDTQHPVTSREPALIHGDTWKGTISPSLSQQMRTHSTHGGFSQVTADVTTQVWGRDSLKSTEESNYTQELNCIHPAEREREREHGRQRKMTVDISYRQPRPPVYLANRCCAESEMENTHVGCARNCACATRPSQCECLVPGSGINRNVVFVQHSS